ncbi:hypothetical protein G4B88_023136 [Cannabis sativa]|uniref:RNase H type-1 domain-containing protein n=1 Tax=Cannabis sativa TaxID=3483 RepID=A0A7J6G6I1_CANSA|nr:hypothetical protein G4B88_023136 [Cannabis sativa]
MVLKKGHTQVISSASIQKSGAPSPIFVEAQALLKGLTWCQNSHFQPLLVLSDCLQLTNRINSKWQDNSALSSLVLMIRQSLCNLLTVSLKHTPRNENAEAHKCAKEALNIQNNITNPNRLIPSSLLSES